MKKFDKWMMPDGEEHLPQWMTNVNRRVHGRLTYQFGKYEAALEYCPMRRNAIDVGSHIGLWAFVMAQDFDHVICFEPMPAHIECWRENMKDIGNAELWEYALGEKEGFVALETRTAGSSGDTQVKPGAGTIPMKPLDFFNFQNIDLVKIDCEGFEEFVLRGGETMLKENCPCVIVEQKGNMSARYGLQKQSAVHYLESLGAVMRAEISGDFILSWDSATK